MSVGLSVRRKFERAFLAQLQINTYFTYGMMRRRWKSRGGEGGGKGGGEEGGEGGGCSHIVMVQTIPELIAYPCLFSLLADFSCCSLVQRFFWL